MFALQSTFGWLFPSFPLFFCSIFFVKKGLCVQFFCCPPPRPPKWASSPRPLPSVSFHHSICTMTRVIALSPSLTADLFWLLCAMRCTFNLCLTPSQHVVSLPFPRQFVCLDCLPHLITPIFPIFVLFSAAASRSGPGRRVPPTLACKHVFPNWSAVLNENKHFEIDFPHYHTFANI